MGKRSEQDELDRVIRNELDKLDEWFAPRVPDAARFEQLVIQAKAEQRRRLKRDLALFSGAAIVSVASGLAGLAYHPAVYGALQGAVLVGFTIRMAIAYKKRTDAS